MAKKNNSELIRLVGAAERQWAVWRDRKLEIDSEVRERTARFREELMVDLVEGDEVWKDTLATLAAVLSVGGRPADVSKIIGNRNWDTVTMMVEKALGVPEFRVAQVRESVPVVQVSESGAVSGGRFVVLDKGVNTLVLSDVKLTREEIDKNKERYKGDPESDVAGVGAAYGYPPSSVYGFTDWGDGSYQFSPSGGVLPVDVFVGGKNAYLLDVIEADVLPLWRELKGSEESGGEGDGDE